MVDDFAKERQKQKAINFFKKMFREHKDNLFAVEYRKFEVNDYIYGCEIKSNRNDVILYQYPKVDDRWDFTEGVEIGNFSIKEILKPRYFSHSEVRSKLDDAKAINHFRDLIRRYKGIEKMDGKKFEQGTGSWGYISSVDLENDKVYIYKYDKNEPEGEKLNVGEIINLDGNGHYF